MTRDEQYRFDKEHIWHPYSSMQHPAAMQMVHAAKGVRLQLEDGTEVIDGMSSWWSAIHGYNVPELNRALETQLGKMAHVMFGGLTHEPAISLAEMLIDVTDPSLQHIFFCDSGSVSVEVAMKMAFQYWHGKGKPRKSRLISHHKGYHGDTFGAMSACDPVTGMHTIFSDILHKNIFIDAPACGFDGPCEPAHLDALRRALETHHEEVAAIIVEPVVQGAGGMRFYSPDYLKELKAMCDAYDVLIIFDEVATGFGRTGKLFAYEHAGFAPDILCIGKAITGGYLSMAATLTSRKVVEGVERGGNVLMHGPTFMGNPLACSVAKASLSLLLESPWQERVRTIETTLKRGLDACRSLEIVKEVRVLGAIGVVELDTPVDLAWMTPRFVQEGVWVRPFMNLVYVMPPYIIGEDDLMHLCRAIHNVVEAYEAKLTEA